MSINHDWLPEGTHHGLVIEHHPTGRGGTYEADAGWKGIIHSTEEIPYDASKRDLLAKEAEPHVLLGKVGSKFHVCQFIPFGQGSRALEHPFGTPNTNNARAIQFEVCAMAINHAKGRGDWPEDLYRALAILGLMVEHRRPIPRRKGRAFSEHPNRLDSLEFVHAGGWYGHEHTPNQPTGHWDPGDFRGTHFIDLMDDHAKEILR